MTDTCSEPPLAGTESEQMIGALERLRATFRRKVDGLDASGLRTRFGASALTLSGLLKRELRVHPELTGDPIGAPWEDLVGGIA